MQTYNVFPLSSQLSLYLTPDQYDVMDSPSDPRRKDPFRYGRDANICQPTLLSTCRIDKLKRSAANN